MSHLLSPTETLSWCRTAVLSRQKQVRYFLTSPVRKRLFGGESLAGTVPHHSTYVILHHPKPPVEYPPKIDKTFSPLYRRLLLSAAQRGGVVNFGWQGVHDGKSVKDNEKARLEEKYSASIFSTKLREKRIDLPEVSLSSLPEIENILDDPVSYLTGVGKRTEERPEVHLYVCTHGSRDCRCGDMGGRLVISLRNELGRRQRLVKDQRKSEGSGESLDVWDRIRIGELAHVGGHKYAANLLIFPFGDWLGRLDAEQAPEILDIVAQRLTSLDPRVSLTALPPIMPSRWRGRLGLSKDEQLALALHV